MFGKMISGHANLTKILATALVVIVLVGAGFVLPIRDWVHSFTDWVQDLGPIGLIAFAIVYVLAVLLVLPTWILTVSAGLAYGLWGIPLVVLSATFGATFAFFIARGALRERVRAWTQTNPMLQALDRVARVEGWKVVGLLRLSPVVPFTLQNYAFGATDIPVWHFVVATFLELFRAHRSTFILEPWGELLLQATT